MHPESDLHTRPTINSKADLKEMYPECFGGVGMFKNFEYEIEVDPRLNQWSMHQGESLLLYNPN